jgi:hypothetical protein
MTEPRLDDLNGRVVFNQERDPPVAKPVHASFVYAELAQQRVKPSAQHIIGA